MVDTNGTQGPNMFGEDSFWFWIILKNGVYSIIPFGSSGDGMSCSKAGTFATSLGCTYQRLNDPNNMPQ